MGWTFKLTLEYKKDENTGWSCDGYDVLLADDLIKLVSQFIVLITSVQRKIHDDKLLELRAKRYEDDIPF